MQEQQHQIKIYDFFQKMVYATVVMDCLCLFFVSAKVPVLSNLLDSFSKLGFFYPPINAKLSTLILISLVAVGTKAKKNKDLNIVKSIVLPIVLGISLMFVSLTLVDEAGNPNMPKLFSFFSLSQVLYMVFAFVGAISTQVGADNISKILKTNLGKDRWNTEEESFDQNRELVETETSINIPYKFRYKGKIYDGWLNIDPFRGTVVIGVPGSGKSFGIINPSIRQFIAKGFSMCLYDFKYPTLGEIAYYHYLLKKKNDPNYIHEFNVINLNEVEKSKRINPLNKKYIKTLAQAQSLSEAMVSALQKGGSSGGGSEQFFTQSAINFLSSCVYFFATYENGKYSDIPHLLSFMNKSYKEIFDTLFSNEELESLLSPFKTAYENKAFDQLEGQIGTLKIFMSRLATKESFWVFSGDEIELKISDRKRPSILVLASDEDTKEINSALYASVFNRILKVINNKGNLPCAVVADEFPTIYLHDVENTIGTARSNQVAIMLGLQEMPQLKKNYKKEIADTIMAVAGNILAGALRNKDTLDWLEKLFGKIKQKTYSQSISQQGTTQSINEKMEAMIPAGKIASLRTGEMVGMLAKGFNTEQEYKTSAMNGRINLNMKKIKKEEKNYVKMPVYYSFKDKSGKDRKNEVLMTNFRRINKEVELVVKQFVA